MKKTAAPAYVTVPDVQLVKVGTWGASQGGGPITAEDLAAMVEAHNSGVLNRGVVKKGHLDPRMENPTWDGDPVYGQVDNLRVSDDGETLLGDYVNVPSELASSLPSAYPNRSVEIAWGVKLKDAAGKVKKEFKAALSGIALLGRTPPAVKGLGEHVAAVSHLSAGVEGDLTVDHTGTVMSYYSLPGGMTSSELSNALRTALRATMKGAGNDDFYPYMEEWDDAHVWFESSGQLYELDYTVGTEGVKFGEELRPVIVKRSYVSAGDTLTIPQQPAPTGNALSVLGTTRASEYTEQEDAAMDELLKQLRVNLGLPETATQDEILAASKAAKEATAAEKPGNTPGAPDGATGANGETAQTGAAGAADAAGTTPEAGKHAAAPVASEDGTVAVSATMLSELLASHSTLSNQVKTLTGNEDAKRRASMLDGYVHAGKVHPSERSYFSELLETAEAPTVKLLDQRVGIPVGEIGDASAQVAHFSSELTNDGMSDFLNTIGMGDLAAKQKGN